MNYVVFGENVRKYRKLANMTQEMLAEMCDCSVGHIDHIENGNNKPSLDELNDRLTSCKNTESREKNIKKRLDDFRKVLEKNEVLVEFDRQVFESIIEKVIVGGYDDDGNKDPSMLTFVYKTGFTNSVDANNHKPPRKNHKKNKEQNENKLSSYSPNEDEKMCSLNSDNTRRDGGTAFPQKARWTYQRKS